MPENPRVATRPVLWQQVKQKYRATSEGSEPGRWSSRKAALSQLEYRDRGGDFKNR